MTASAPAVCQAAFWAPGWKRDVAGGRGLMQTARKVMPVPVHFRVRINPSLENREIRLAVRALQICVFHHSKARIRLSVDPWWSGLYWGGRCGGGRRIAYGMAREMHE